MLNENAKKWVAALRSGKYEQGKGALRTNDKLCCLGVGCEVAIENGEIIEHETRHTDNGAVEHYYDAHSELLPPSVQTWLGLRTDGGFTSGGDDLTLMNDSRGKTFAEIADFVESEPKGLFVKEAAA